MYSNSFVLNWYFSWINIKHRFVLRYPVGSLDHKIQQKILDSFYFNILVCIWGLQRGTGYCSLGIY